LQLEEKLRSWQEVFKSVNNVKPNLKDMLADKSIQSLLQDIQQQKREKRRLEKLFQLNQNEIKQ